MTYEYDAADDASVDAWHDGYLNLAPRPSCPLLAAEWEAGAEQAKSDRRMRPPMIERPEGYYHQRPEAA